MQVTEVYEPSMIHSTWLHVYHCHYIVIVSPLDYNDHFHLSFTLMFTGNVDYSVIVQINTGTWVLSSALLHVYVGNCQIKLQIGQISVPASYRSNLSM